MVRTGHRIEGCHGGLRTGRGRTVEQRRPACGQVGPAHRLRREHPERRVVPERHRDARGHQHHDGHDRNRDQRAERSSGPSHPLPPEYEGYEHDGQATRRHHDGRVDGGRHTECQCGGGRPPPSLTWSNGSQAGEAEQEADKQQQVLDRLGHDSSLHEERHRHQRGHQRAQGGQATISHLTQESKQHQGANHPKDPLEHKDRGLSEVPEGERPPDPADGGWMTGAWRGSAQIEQAPRITRVRRGREAEGEQDSDHGRRRCDDQPPRITSRRPAHGVTSHHADTDRAETSPAGSSLSAFGRVSANAQSTIRAGMIGDQYRKTG